MQDLFFTLKDWWPVILIGLVALAWQYFEIVGKIWKSVSTYRARTEPIKLQYTTIHARVTMLKPSGDLEVEVIVALDNPTEFPIRLSTERMLTTISYMNTDDIPQDYATIVLAARTQRVRMQSRPIHLPYKKGRYQMPGYVEWQIKYGRDDVEPFEFTHLFNLRGNLSLNYIHGGWETRWMPFDDSELQVEDEHVEWLVNEKGDFTRRR